MLLPHQDGHIHTCGHGLTKLSIMGRFILAQFNHARRDDDPLSRESFQHLQGRFRALRVTVEGIVNDGDTATIRQQFQPMCHRLKLPNAPGNGCHRYTQMQGNRRRKHHILDVVHPQKPCLARDALISRAKQEGASLAICLDILCPHIRVMVSMDCSKHFVLICPMIIFQADATIIREEGNAICRQPVNQ